MQLHQVQSPAGSHKRRKIVGRGRGSGHGKRSGRGQTGQNSRAGRGVITGYEGGQATLLRRLPKVGFNSKWPANYQIVNLDDLKSFKEGAVVDPQALKDADLIKSSNRPVKILGDGELKKKLTVHAHRFSQSAQEKIAKLGGQVQLITGPVEPPKGSPRVKK